MIVGAEKMGPQKTPEEITCGVTLAHKMMDGGL